MSKEPGKKPVKSSLTWQSSQIESKNIVILSSYILAKFIFQKGLEYPLARSFISATTAKQLEDEVTERLVREMRKAPKAAAEESE